MEEWVKRNQGDKARPKVVLVPAARIPTKAAPPKATHVATADPPEEARRQKYNADSDDSEDRDRATAPPCQNFAGMLLGVAKPVTYYSPAEWTDEAPQEIAKTPAQPVQLTPNDQDDYVEAKGERRQRTEDDSDESARKSARLAGEPPFPDMGPQVPRNTDKIPARII